MKILDAEKLNNEFFKNLEQKNIQSVREILINVKNRKDSAVREYTKKFDNLDIKTFQIIEKQIKDAYSSFDKKTINALKFAAANIKRFAKEQLRDFKNIEINNGVFILLRRICTRNWLFFSNFIFVTTLSHS
jgi:histidinol dehydrogenase